ncbi:hypothetical protein SLS60_005079 [Paraconiothyrium brasiliense]|uniref:Uncharacterized protein n=1 Tax=Paraconiothyrium brasiliense TaxID=300254 RepID=A0ABR3RHW9_9PLEO
MLIIAFLAVAATLVNAVFNAVLSEQFVPSSNHTVSTLYGLTRRFDKSATAPDELWADALCRGEQFVSAFEGTDEEAGKIFKSTANPPTMQNQWQGDQKSDLAKWGWTEVDANDHGMCDYSQTFWGYDTSYDALGLNKKPKFSGFPKILIPNGGDNICYELWHGDNKLNAGHEVPFVHQLYEVDGEEYSVGLLRSRRGLWYRDNANIKNIKYFWTQQVANSESASIIASALKMWGKELTKWPGATWSMESDEGKALLGSPNAISFGYFLISHKKELGNKKITKVQVFLGDEKRDVADEKTHPEMLFYVEDVKGPGGQQGIQQP